MKKRFLSIVVAICMVFTLIPAMAMTTEAAGTGTSADPIVVYRNPVEDYAGDSLVVENYLDAIGLVVQFKARETTLDAWTNQIIKASGVSNGEAVQWYVSSSQFKRYVGLKEKLIGYYLGSWFGWNAAKSQTAGTDKESRVQVVDSNGEALTGDLTVLVKGYVDVAWNVGDTVYADQVSLNNAINNAENDFNSSDTDYAAAVTAAEAYATEQTNATNGGVVWKFLGWDTDADGDYDANDEAYLGKTVDVTTADNCLAAETVDGATFAAVYSTVESEYVVSWVDEDGTVLEKDENVPYGTTPSYDGEKPTKAANAQYTYTFDGWTPTVSAVVGDVTYKATYKPTVNEYTVTWIDEDGTVLEEDKNVPYGTTPSYDGEEPTKAADAQNEYVFADWTPNTSAITGDVTYTATYKVEGAVTYKVTFENEGSFVSDAEVVYGTEVTVPSTEKDGYRFLGWATTADGAVVYNVGDKITVKESMTLYAQWVEQVTVSFDTNDGTPVTSQTFDINGTATKPADPTKTGYVFNGWYADEACTTVFDFTKEITADTTVYADWLAVYTVKFDANGGTGSMAAQTFTEGTAQTLAANDFEPNGYYTFAGWATSSVGDVVYADKAEVTVTSNMTLYAVWEKIVIPTSIALGYDTVEVTYGDFTSDDLLGLIQPVVMANNTAVEGAEVTITDITANDAGEYTVTITYAGEDPYKASEATATVVINKAVADVVVKSQTVKYGETIVDPIKANCETIDIIAGIDGHDETYLVGSVQITLPEEMMFLLALAGYDADELADLTIDELKTILGAAAKVDPTVASVVATLKEYTDTIEKLIDTLKEIQDELPMDSELVISIVDEVTLPTNVGVYLIGSIAADKNYVAEEANNVYSGMDAGYLIITPNGIKAELTWNDTDDNDIITLGKLSRFDLGATATVIESTVEGATHPDDVNEHVEYLFIGVDEDGELLLDRTTNPTAMKMGLGVYAQVAYVANWDNVMYYAEPIARPIIVAPTVADVAILDVNGNENYAQVFTYDGTPKSVTVTVDGKENVEGLTVEYIGSDTTVDGWYRTEAPTDAGVFTVVATYTKTIGGNLVKAGGAVGVLIIEPADEKVGLEDARYEYDGNQYFATITNPALDYITVAIDRDENIAYVNLPEDTEAHIDRIVGMMPAEVETEIQAILEKYADFDGDVQTSTVKAELTAIINALIEVDMSAETVAMAEALVDQLAAELESNEDIQAMVDELQAQLAALEEELRGQIPDDMEATLEEYIKSVVTVGDDVQIDVDKVKADIKAKIAEVEGKLPEAVVAELYEMADEVIAVIESNVDVAVIEAELDNIVSKFESLEAVDAETVVKYILGAAYGVVDMSQVEELLAEVVEKVEARGYVDYLVRMAENIAGMYGGDIDTSEVTAAVEALAVALEAKLQSGNIDSDDLDALETYVDDILASLLTVVDQIPEGTIIFGQNPSEVGIYDCYAINISANYKAEFVSAELEIYEADDSDEEEPGTEDPDKDDPIEDEKDDTPQDTGKTDVPDSPKTGDVDLNFMLMGILVAAIGVLIASIVIRRKITR